MLQHLVKHLAKRCFMQNVANLQKPNTLYHKDLFQEPLIKLKQIQILENGNTKSDPKNLEVLVPINRSFFGTRQ
jgi:hypothetical protein